VWREGDMKCKSCNSNLVLTNCPKVLFDIIIPFTHKRFSIQLWDWDNQEPQCFECIDDRRAKHEERIFDAGYQTATQDIVKNLSED
jgi:hypothetical protein